MTSNKFLFKREVRFRGNGALGMLMKSLSSIWASYEYDRGDVITAVFSAGEKWIAEAAYYRWADEIGVGFSIKKNPDDFSLEDNMG